MLNCRRSQLAERREYLKRIFEAPTMLLWDFPSGASGKKKKKKKSKNPSTGSEDVRDLDSVLGSGKIPWKRKWQPTPVFLPGEFHG